VNHSLKATATVLCSTSNTPLVHAKVLDQTRNVTVTTEPPKFLRLDRLHQALILSNGQFPQPWIYSFQGVNSISMITMDTRVTPLLSSLHQDVIPKSVWSISLNVS
ncbi:hypothetical protein BGZ79_003999, partial [Entomortierella chlamydospora]